MTWALQMGINAVVWTALKTNFQEKTKQPFSVAEVVAYMKELDPEGKATTAEYVWRAPTFVRTPVRSALQREPRFREEGR